MSLIPVRGTFGFRFVSLVCACVLSAAAAARCAEDGAPIESFVESGEFGPALAAAGDGSGLL